MLWRSQTTERLEDLKTKNKSFYGMVYDVTEVSRLADCVSSAEKKLGIDTAILMQVYIQDGKDIDPSVYQTYGYQLYGSDKCLGTDYSIHDKAKNRSCCNYCINSWMAWIAKTFLTVLQKQHWFLLVNPYISTEENGVKLQVICPVLWTRTQLIIFICRSNDADARSKL